jgi:CHAD domain-containing protein
MTLPDTEGPATTCESSFRGITLACAQAKDAALAVFLETDDSAGPHKARVALRRLTTALDAFAAILRRRGAAEVRARAKQIFRALGRVRDSDVHLAEAATASAALMARNRALREKTRRSLRRARMVGFTQDLRARVQEDGPLFRRSAKARALRAAPVADLAAQVLDAAWDNGRGYGPSVRRIPEASRHEFRKDMKTLRYLAEFFADLFPALQDDPVRSDFRDIQDALGIWNDFAVALRIERRKPPPRPPAKVAEALATAEAAWARLCAVRPPWGDQATRRP